MEQKQRQDLKNELKKNNEYIKALTPEELPDGPVKALVLAGQELKKELIELSKNLQEDIEKKKQFIRETNYLNKKMNDDEIEKVIDIMAFQDNLKNTLKAMFKKLANAVEQIQNLPKNKENEDKLDEKNNNGFNIKSYMNSIPVPQNVFVMFKEKYIYEILLCFYEANHINVMSEKEWAERKTMQLSILTNKFLIKETQSIIDVDETELIEFMQLKHRN